MAEQVPPDDKLKEMIDEVAKLIDHLPGDGEDEDTDLHRFVRTMSVEEKRELARERAASGERPEQTAHHMGISLATVYRYLKD